MEVVEKSRQRILRITLAMLVLAIGHLVDHAIRGALVDHHHLDPLWNHSGWPFRDIVSPFTFIGPIVLAVTGFGLYLTYKTSAWAKYWFASGIILGGVVAQVHFFSGIRTESPYVIYHSYADALHGALGVALGVFANLWLAALMVTIGWLIFEAYRVLAGKNL